MIRVKASHALYFLDRFEIMAHLIKIMNDMRTQESSTKTEVDEPVLMNVWWLLLKRPKNLSAKWEFRLAESMR